MTLHFLKDVTNDASSTLKIENYVMISILKSKTMGKLINRIQGLCLLISSLLGSPLRTHVESLGKPCDVSKRSQSLASKDTQPEYSYLMPVCIIVKTITPRCSGRPDALLHVAEGRVQ